MIPVKLEVISRALVEGCPCAYGLHMKGVMHFRANHLLRHRYLGGSSGHIDSNLGRHALPAFILLEVLWQPRNRLWDFEDIHQSALFLWKPVSKADACRVWPWPFSMILKMVFTVP